jgi:hypothetical protein
VTNTMGETQIKGDGAGDQLLPGTETHTSAEKISKSEHINHCPECGGPLQFGSRDPCEGDYYWCHGCGAGPVRFPLGTGPRKPVPAIAEAEQRKAFVQYAVVH